MATELTSQPTASAMSHVFERVLVGVDSTEASLDAARQAAILAEHYGDLTVLGAYPPPPHLGFKLPDEHDVASARRRAEKAVEKAAAAEAGVLPPQTKVSRGYGAAALIEEATSARDTLIVVGSHDQGRIGGIVGGSTATELVHRAPCSVLVARHTADRFPGLVVVGLDGSPESASAYLVARRLAARFGTVIHAVVARTDRHLDLAAIHNLTGGEVTELAGDPVTALLAAAADADLLIVGSRGLHGLKALGSVSERVAHKAHCSVLVVRPRDAQGKAPRWT